MEPRTKARDLRRNPTEPERRLWSALQPRSVSGVRFNRQVVIGRYICDFVARTPKLIIEVDGDKHATQAEYDMQRTAELEHSGYIVIRFSNSDIMSNLEGVVAPLTAALAALPPPTPSRKREGN